MPFPRAGRAVQRLSAAAMGALLLASAMKHFRDPGFYRQVVPDYLCREDGAADGGTCHGAAPSRPFALLSRDEWIAVSGLLELAAAVGILVPGTRKATATATTIMFAAFLAGHVDALRRAYGPQGTPVQRKVHSVRLPLQAPLIVWVWSLRKPAAGAGL
ncbi:hypothetical protein FHJ30_02250 [Arthrobacter sp. BB-1]|uniref:hypothetical protein n=1 Tax=unclassified Arthrobacter TaxID=235627 RepID=UPI001112C55D|nr:MULTISPECIES: hypothetical protein [unclassified Arthrobacter]TNB76414.1 hypothetical protein FHJ30_02250 [Arthrobacter sp. BB-1]